tara:strand:+ start:758 stop:1951 length:1194 start_codon:yes stop_codon:yes gene_type:complete
MSKSNILLKISGSIAAYKIGDLISMLVQRGYEVQTVASPSALKFIGPATLEGLSGRAVLTDTYESGKMMAHINLTKWSHLTILAPATANTINKIGYGLGEDLLSTMFLAHDWAKPYFLAPAMNTNMLNHPATQESIERLKRWGVNILNPESGKLACGGIGYGRMMETDNILKTILPYLKKEIKPSILICSGGTKDPLDAVRYITNLSTGKTGANLTDVFLKKNWSVTYLTAVEGVRPLGDCKIITFSTSDDLKNKILNLVSNNNFDAVIHLAAVSDFSNINYDSTKKISSENEKLVLEMVRTPKIVNSIRRKSKNKNMRLIAFKLTSNAGSKEIEQQINKLFKNANADLIVHNDLSGRENNIQHEFNVYNKAGLISTLGMGSELGDFLESQLKKVLV